MADKQQPRRKPKPRHAATHITVWNMNGSPVAPQVLNRIEAAVEAEIDNERMLMQTVRI